MLELNDEDRGQLRIILESQADLGAKFHGIIASELFKLYKATSDPAKKLVFGLEVFCKLMQILEDVGLFCLTWLDAEKSGDPLGEYLDTSTKNIIRFYEHCAEGLTDAEVTVIQCIPTVEEALASGKLDANAQDQYRKKIGVVCEAIRVVFKGFAAMYTEKPDGQIGNIRYGDIVNMYFNIRHGVKVLWPHRPLNLLFFKHHKIRPTTLPILVGPREVVEGSTARRGLHFASFDFTEPFVARMTENCFYISNTLSGMAEERLKWIENGGERPMITGAYSDLVGELREGVQRSRLPETEKEAILARWPLYE